LQTLRMKGFSPKWIGWIKSFVSGGSVAVNVNDEVGPFFQTRKGLRQGDPLSPILFNIVADMLTLFINRAKADNQLGGVVPRVHQTGGNRSGLTDYRSNRSGPVSVWAGIKPAQIQNSNLNLKNEKFLKKILKILQGATNIMVSNFLKKSFI